MDHLSVVFQGVVYRTIVLPKLYFDMASSFRLIQTMNQIVAILCFKNFTFLETVTKQD